MGLGVYRQERGCIGERSFLELPRMDSGAITEVVLYLLEYFKYFTMKNWG